eukprot:5204307-Pyramimonas_sp.AAC.1
MQDSCGAGTSEATGQPCGWAPPLREAPGLGSGPLAGVPRVAFCARVGPFALLSAVWGLPLALLTPRASRAPRP